MSRTRAKGNGGAATLIPTDDAEKSITSPFSVAIDTREQRPYTFEGLRANADQDNALIRVPTMRITLDIGDYSLVGNTGMISIERKSKEDLYSSISQRRENFEERLRKMQSLCMAAIVVEAQWDSLLLDPPAHTAFNPKALARTILAWMIRYPRVQWLMLPDRTTAEAITYRLLEQFHAAYKAGKTPDQEHYQSILDGTARRIPIVDPATILPPWESAQP